MPNLLDFDSVLDLFSFCNLMIMANVLDLRTYDAVPGVAAKHDVNGISTKERYEMSYARGRCWDILHWFFSAYEIFDKGTDEAVDGFKLVAMQYLWQQGMAILEFKRKALEADPSHFGVEAVERQLKFCFLPIYSIPNITRPAPDSAVSLAFPEPQKYGVRKLDVPKTHECKHVTLRAIFPFLMRPLLAPDSFIELGTTVGDGLFFKYLTKERS